MAKKITSFRRSPRFSSASLCSLPSRLPNKAASAMRHGQTSRYAKTRRGKVTSSRWVKVNAARAIVRLLHSLVSLRFPSAPPHLPTSFSSSSQQPSSAWTLTNDMMRHARRGRVERFRALVRDRNRLQAMRGWVRWWVRRSGGEDGDATTNDRYPLVAASSTMSEREVILRGKCESGRVEDGSGVDGGMGG